MICKNNKSQVHLPLEGLQLAWTSFNLIGIDNLPIRWILCWKLLEMLRLWWMTTQADLESTFSWNSSKAWVRKSIQLTVYLSVCLSVCLSICPDIGSFHTTCALRKPSCSFVQILFLHWLKCNVHPSFSLLPSLLWYISWYIGKGLRWVGWSEGRQVGWQIQGCMPG